VCAGARARGREGAVSGEVSGALCIGAVARVQSEERDRARRVCGLRRPTSLGCTGKGLHGACSAAPVEQSALGHCRASTRVYTWTLAFEQQYAVHSAAGMSGGPALAPVLKPRRHSARSDLTPTQALAVAEPGPGQPQRPWPSSASHAAASCLEPWLVGQMGLAFYVGWRRRSTAPSPAAPRAAPTSCSRSRAAPGAAGAWRRRRGRRPSLSHMCMWPYA